MVISKHGGFPGKTAPPPLELVFDVATRARLIASPLTSGMGSADGISFEEAVGLVLSSTPVLPVVSDPDLAVVARVAERDPDLAEQLLAGIAALRAELATLAEQLGDAVLSASLAASAMAAAAFDAVTHTLPLPNDDDIGIVIDAVNREVARVTDTLAGLPTVVPDDVVHRKILTTLHTASPLVPIPKRSATAEPLVRRVEEAAAIARLSVRDTETRNAAVALAGCLYWQDEMLRQALAAEELPDDDATDVPAIITRVHLGHLAFSLGLAEGIGKAGQQRVAKTAPTTLSAPTPYVLDGYGPPSPFFQDPDDPYRYRMLSPWEAQWLFMTDPAFDGDHIYDPETDSYRELTPRERIIRNWGVAGGLFGWVAGSGIGVLTIPYTGGTGPFIGQYAGLIGGIKGGMSLGEWIANRYYPELR
ncbi:hypothetical protein [Actinocorallia sp. A-T 12471]|uniref:hypothetical protein n=1 Tax=Actinocorallia sp. A-T 12471 TaxID=3089813 RepID=UPI0029D1DA62|nr:hypothetical protein [Actinocorallia sp. A-T 12471]MDX6740928.1 hypothetical protein [Actinocorallia sp. A-T 12471]